MTQNRVDDGVLDIRITKGVGAGLNLSFGHVNPDTDLDAEGVQYLGVGTIAKQGDVIAHTGRTGISPGGDAATMVGIINPRHPGVPGWGVYHPQQEWMLVGFDGQPNVICEE